MSMLRICAAGLGLAALALTASAFRLPQAGSTDPAGYKLTKQVPLPDAGRQDYLSEDVANRRLYVSHSTEVLALDMDSLAVVGKIPNTPGVHGIAISDKDGHGFTTNGGDNTLTEFDLKSLAVIKRIPSPKKGVDGVIYDPSTDRVFAFCGDSASAVAVDAKSGDVVGTIDLGGGPEFAAADGKGHIFNVLEDKSEILDLDAKGLTVVHRYPLAPCEGPSGVAMDTAHRRVFVGCHSGVMAIVNADTGAIVATPPIGSGVDAARFDPGTQLAFTSNGNSTITVVHEDSPDHFTELGNIATVPGARTMALDTKTHTLYSATNRFGPTPPPATPGGRAGRPPIIAGSFTLFVITKQ